MTTIRKRKKVNRRRVRKSPDPLTKLEVYFVTMNEVYKAARKSGYTKEMAFWIMQEPNALPDWISNDKPDAIIPRIDPDDEDDD